MHSCRKIYQARDEEEQVDHHLIPSLIDEILTNSYLSIEMPRDLICFLLISRKIYPENNLDSSTRKTV